jgi:hypothetical protein
MFSVLDSTKNRLFISIGRGYNYAPIKILSQNGELGVMEAISGSIPEQGQLVSVRSRNWVVTEVLPSTLPADGLKAPLPNPQNLLTLSSVEDDDLGEELQVIWELEPGARLIEKVAMPEPTGFDPPDQLDAFLDAVRWGASSSADVRNIQAPFRSGIDIEDYQLDPVVRTRPTPPPPCSERYMPKSRSGEFCQLTSWGCVQCMAGSN